MTSMERVLAAVRGDTVDRKPTILLAGGEGTDVLIYRDELPEPGAVRIREVLSVFGRAQRAGFNLNDLLAVDPEAGGRELDRICTEVSAEFDRAETEGAEGVCYRLIGAEPKYTTPMQYGGYYLERDRELLEGIRGAAFNLVWIDAGEEAYLDFVSDLPAHAFAWDIDQTGVSVAAMRAVRKGALAAEDPTADLLFARDYEAVRPWIERVSVHHA